MTVTLTASPSPRQGRAPFRRLRQAEGPGCETGPCPWPDRIHSSQPFRPEAVSQDARAAPAPGPATVPPVEAVSSRSPWRTMAGTWKSQSGRTSSTLTSTPKARARPARWRASPSGRPATNRSWSGARTSSEASEDSRRVVDPRFGQKRRPARQRFAAARQAGLELQGVENERAACGPALKADSRPMTLIFRKCNNAVENK